VAQRYSQRPSAIMGIPPESPLALDFDVAIMTRATIAELRRAEQMARSEPGMVHIDAEKLGAGMQFGVM